MAQHPFQTSPREEPPHKVISPAMKQAVSQLEFSADPVPGNLFDAVACAIAEELGNDDRLNKPTQIRRFYDELAGWQQRIKGSEEAFKKYEAFIRMMNAKVAYAKGRKLVDANFEHWFREGIKATTSAKALDNFRLHFEAVLGFLKGPARLNGQEKNMQLKEIRQIRGMLVLKTGLHIGGGDTEMRIGGIDNQVVKNPVSDQPYIPGSSLKGKMRSLLEWRHGLVSPENNGDPFSFKQLKESEIDTAAGDLLRLFGGAPDKNVDDKIKKIGPTRLSFWDCALNAEWKKSVLDERNLQATEAKSENSINRISGVADNPRFTERVVAGAEFDFRLTLKVHDDEDLLDMVLAGLKLLEYDSLGGSGSRGYGKIEFRDLRVDDVLVQGFDQLQPFTSVA